VPFDFNALIPPGRDAQAYPAGSAIFSVGEPGSEMYVIASGQVQIRLGDLVLDTVGAGEVIGEMALLDHSVRSASAFALTHCTVLRIDREALLEWVRAAPAVALELARVMVRRLRAMDFSAQHDSLTRLPNRALFKEKCAWAILRARRLGSGAGVLFIDLDHFKTINDSLGHAAGDVLLHTVATRLRGVLDELDTLARLGADEFAVLLEGVADARKLAARAQILLDIIAQPIPLVHTETVVSASIGISCYPQDGADAQTLLENADTAMQAAKSGGRNQYCFFSSELSARALEDLTLRDQLRQAVAKDELVLLYQPRVDAATGELTGVEALLRWHHPESGIVSPAQFIPIAEETGMIEAIGDWVLKSACAQRKAWSDRGMRPFRMAVNLSVRQLAQPGLVARLQALLQQTGLPAGELELEITESFVMTDPEQGAQTVKELRALGIAIALDDFGTAYSSLGYLKRIDFDYLKIDQSFVRGLPDDGDDVAITRTIITLARNLHLKVIAEGVETPAQLAFLQAEGCDEIQGYLVSPPLAAQELEAFVVRGAVSGGNVAGITNDTAPPTV
jgi:diguanylate cyclase (GGDEF)-like protein